MKTLITWEHSNSAPVIRENQPTKFCLKMALNGGFYKVQIVDQETAAIEEYKQ